MGTEPEGVWAEKREARSEKREAREMRVKLSAFEE